MKRSGLFSLLLLWLLLAACSTGTASQLGATPTTVRQTPTLGIPPTPTIPDVPSQLVHFFTPDHIQLAGLLYGHGKTAVVCSHELHTSKIIWSATGIVQRLALRGYLVLAYDFRGNGDSQGQADISRNADDLHAAISFIRQQGATRIILLGSSMGGTATLKVAASEQVAAVITLSAPQAIGVEVSDADLKAIMAPKLFVNSQDDSYADDTTHMYASTINPKELHMYPGSAHGTSIFDTENGGDLTQRILSFVAHYAPPS